MQFLCSIQYQESFYKLTERKAWMRSALMDANGFPLTIMVYVSSFSVDIKLPNQERFVNSGEGSGVGFSDISSTIKTKMPCLEFQFIDA